MRVPFSVDQFFDVFRDYNETMWPAQLVLYALALAALALALSRVESRGRWIGAILGFLWLWMGAVYHLSFFAIINPAAVLFGLLFIAEGIALFGSGVGRRPLRFQPRADASGLSGGVLILYALVVYPALGYVLGHRYPASPTFGVPCPTTIFTLGILLWAADSLPLRILVIPVLWSVLGVSAVLSFGVVEDTGLIIAAVVTTILTVRRRRRFGHRGLASAGAPQEFKVLPIKPRLPNA